MTRSVYDLLRLEEELLDYEATLQNDPEDVEEEDLDELIARGLARGEDFDDVRVSAQGALFAYRVA